MTAPAKAIPALPGPYSVDAVINRLILVAGSQEGYREGRDSSGWDNDNAFGVWYPMNRQPWCAMFVSWSAYKAGISESVILKHAYTPTGYAWFKSKGQAVSAPRRGDIFYVYSASQGLVHHVGIVESVGNGFVNTIEGNTNTNGSPQGDGVYRLHRQITSRLRFVRPNYAACVKPAPPKPPVQPPTKPPVTPPAADKSLHLWALSYATKGKGMNGETLHDAQQFTASARAIAAITPAQEAAWKAAVTAGTWTKASTLFVGIVKRVQAKAGLAQDGVPGAKTADYMRRACGYTILP